MRSPSFRHSTEVQTVLFDVSAFTPATAAAWARSHGFRAPAGDVTARYIRLRQREPAAYRAGTFRTITLTDGVLAVVGVPKTGGNLKPRKNAGRGTGHGSTAYLLDFSTGRIVREATPAEHRASQKQIERDGIGIIVIDGREYITETDVVRNPARHNGRAATSGSTRPTRTAQVTAYLAANGFPGLKLHKGAGYLYVSGGGSETWPETSIMTYRVSNQTLDQWLSDVRRLAGGARRNTGAGAHYEEARTAIRRAIAARGAPDYDARYVEAAHALNRAERHREQTPTFLAPRGSVPVPPMATHRPWRRNPASRLEMLHHHLKDVEEAAQRHKPAVARYLYKEAAAYLPRRNGAERVTVPGMGTGVVVAHRPGGMCDIRLSGGQVVRKSKSTLKPA
jgi:hypothetical protein